MLSYPNRILTPTGIFQSFVIWVGIILYYWQCLTVPYTVSLVFFSLTLYSGTEALRGIWSETHLLVLNLYLMRFTMRVQIVHKSHSSQ